MHNKDKMGRQLNMDELEQVTGGVQDGSESKVVPPANAAYACAVLDHQKFKAPTAEEERSAIENDLKERANKYLVCPPNPYHS